MPRERHTNPTDITMHDQLRIARLLLLILALAALAGCGIAPSSSASLAQPAIAAPQERSTGVPPPSPLPTTAPTPILRVHFIDVGQGDSILIQEANGATALIDGGYDNGLALAYLKRLEVSRIDLLIASHPHADHIGGLIEVLHAMPVGEVWTSGASHTTGMFETFLDAIANAKVPYHEAQTGDTIALGSLQFAVLRSDPHAADLNDTSLVLRLADQHVSFLFTGDAERPSEEALLRTAHDQLTSTILKVGHHGSSTSSSPAFLAAIRPQVAVYSAGRSNSYGHPHQETIRALEAAGALIYGTDRDGTVVVSTNGTSYQVATSRGDNELSPAIPQATATQSTAAADETPAPTSAPRPTPSPVRTTNPCRQQVNPASAPNAPIIITQVDKVAEMVTIQNTGAATVDLSGWVICSLLGTQLHAHLEGTLPAGEMRAIPSQAGRAIWNNRSAERAAVYNSVGQLISYWSEEQR
jgi:competence protein ComEC